MERGREGVPEKVTLEKDLRDEPWERLREGVPGRRNSRCKGPGVGLPSFFREHQQVKLGRAKGRAGQALREGCEGPCGIPGRDIGSDPE